MKLLTFILLVLLSNLSCQFQTNLDCKRFKTGRLKIYSELNNMTYSIIRDKTKQFETEKETGREAEWEIIWLNDCEYKLILLKDNSGILTSGQFKTAPSFIYKIISTTSDYYIFETRIPPAMQLITDTIFLVK